MNQKGMNELQMMYKYTATATHIYEVNSLVWTVDFHMLVQTIVHNQTVRNL